MRSEIIINRRFVTVFAISILFFVAMNLYIYFESHCHHCVWKSGFPLIFREEFYGSLDPVRDGEPSSTDFDLFSLWRLIVNILIVISSSMGIGTIFSLRRKF